MINIIILLFSLINKNLSFPSIGNKYSTTIKIPFIGHQIIETTMINNNIAFIKLDGIINENGIARYLYNDKKQLVYLSWNLRKMMKKCRSNFSFPYYDIDNDRIIFILKVKPIFLKKKIILERC